MPNPITTDILIVGAGASGIPAVIGGAITDYYVNMLCGAPVAGVLPEVEKVLKQHLS